MLTTLGCPETPDPRNSSVDKFLRKLNEEEMKTIPVGSAQDALDRGIPQTKSKNFLTEEFLEVREVPEMHPRVVKKSK